MYALDCGGCVRHGLTGPVLDRGHWARAQCARLLLVHSSAVVRSDQAQW
jgi:hypothetical protein